MMVKEIITDFLRDHSMYHGDVALEDYIALFQSEMDSGLAGESSSLAMIPTYIDAKPDIPRNKKVIVLDAGGTNLRSALVHFDDQGKPIIENFSKIPMPGFEREVSLDEFYTIFAGRIKEMAHQSDAIGFCFSYPAEITEDCDALPLLFTKEIKAPEVIGKPVGENLRAYLKKAGVSCEQRVVVLNDTVATLLTGMAVSPDRDYDGYQGYILGTGLNSCYVEDSSAIGKIAHPGSLPVHQIINTESGGFSKLPRGTADKSYDGKTTCPGDYFQEKMCSGGYFGSLVQETVELAASQGVIAPATAQNITALGSLTTIDVNRFVTHPQDGENRLVQALSGEPKEESEKLYWIIDQLLERAAKVTAGSMAGAILKSQRGRNPLNPYCLTVDGTTFYALYRFQFRVETYLNQIFSHDDKRYYEIVKVEDAPLLGAAIAALTN